jgi:DNA-binding LacI/PurR family transcriptional regulator
MLSSSTSAGQVYREILRYVRIHRIGKGEFLPAQPQFQKELGCGTIPFNKAMRMLEAQGVVERRKKYGTRLLRGAPAERVPWTIALCGAPVSERYGGLSASVWRQYMHTLLQQAGCQVRLYDGIHRPRLHHELSEFGAFVEDMEGGEIDGAIVPARLMTCEYERLMINGVVECTVRSACSAEESGLVMDQGPMIRQGVELFAGEGRERIAMVMPGAPWIPEKPYFEKTFREAMGHFPQSTGLEFKVGGKVGGGMEMGERLLAMRPEDRPDALICLQDDYVTLGIAHVLHLDPGYRPGIVTITNRQSPLPFPLPVYRFELDLMDAARQAVDYLLAGLHAPDQKRPAQRIVPRLNEAEASELPQFMVGWGRHAVRPAPSVTQLYGALEEDMGESISATKEAVIERSAS